MRAAIGLAAGALLLLNSTSAMAQATPGASTELKTAGGETVGTATFMQESGGVHLKAQFKGLPPGDHGIHIHAAGKCDAPDFMSAGGHFNPTNKQHGLNNPQGAHAGDMPNLKVGPDGTATYDAMLEDVTLSSGAGSLFGPDGTSLMVHANADDDVTDPSGNSGGRIACGVIMRAGTAAAAPAAQPSPAAKPAAPAPAAKPAAPAAPAAQPSPATRPAAPAQAPAATKPSAAPSPAALPRTGAAPIPVDAALPAAVAGMGAILTGLAVWRRRK